MLLFLSSVSLPRKLIEQDWFRTVATYNPVSYLVEGMRSLIIIGWDGEALALGFGHRALLVARRLITLASAALRTRLVADMRRFPTSPAPSRGARSTTSSPTRRTAARR